MNYYNSIKEELINNEITKKVKSYSINKSDLDTYYKVGKMLSEAGKHYGEGIIKNYSLKLRKEVDKKYNDTNLKRMRQFYLLIEKGATLGHLLSWSHYRLLIPLENINIINYYIDCCLKRNLSVRQLDNIIKSQEYERLPEETRSKIINNKEVKVKDLIKDPIVINNKNNYDIVTEKILQKMILENIESFMRELGNSLSFVGSEYKIKIGSNYNYIDLLLFNIEYNCYVVVELKITELKKEHIGQIEVYMNYIDKNLRKVNQDKTIGIILVKKDNEFILEYSSDKRIMARTYEFV